MKNNRLSIIIIFLFLIVSTGLPFYSFEGYSILSNTTSHLGAQGSPYAWLMNLVFIALGLMSIWITFQSKILYHQILGLIFGFSLVLTGIFQHAPLNNLLPINLLHDQLHSIFATTTGFSFTLLAAGHGFISIGMQRTVGIIMSIVATLLSILMVVFPDVMGILQRLMFISAFGWLFFFMVPPKKRQYSKIRL